MFSLIFRYRVFYYSILINILDERSKLANMLTMATGMRAGKIQSLRVQDLVRTAYMSGIAGIFRMG